MEDEEPRDDEPQNFRLVRRIEYTARIHHMAFSSVLQEGGLPPAQAGALRIIIRTPGMSQRELADRLHIQRATVTVMLQKMERAGYVDRRADPMDQRIFRIFPTQAAIQLDEEDRRAVDSYFNQVFQDFAPQEQQQLDDMLNRLAINIRKVLDSASKADSKE